MSDTSIDVFQAEDNRRLKITLRRLENLTKAHRKTLELNKELINKIVHKASELSKVKSENIKLTRRALDLMFSLSLKTSEANKLKQLIWTMYADVYKICLALVGSISTVLQKNRMDLTDHNNYLEKFDIEKTPEGQMIKSPLGGIKSFRYNHAKLSARKKYEREFKVQRETSDIFSPISEFKTPKIDRSRRIQGRQLFCVESQKNKRNKKNQSPSTESKCNNSSHPSNDRTPYERRIHSKKSNSNAGENIAKKVKRLQSNKRISNSYFSDKGKEDKEGGSIRRSERIKMKFTKMDMSVR